MAVSMLMVAGRFGAVVGSNVTSFLLDSYCEYTFYVPGALFAGELPRRFLTSRQIPARRLPFFPLQPIKIDGLNWSPSKSMDFTGAHQNRSLNCRISLVFSAAAFLVYLIPYQENRAKLNEAANPRASVISFR